MLIAKVIDLIQKLVKDEFYGKIEISFEKGQVVFVKRTETLK